MGLEQLLTRIHTDAHSRITHRTKRELADHIHLLNGYALTDTQRHRLNESAAALQRRAYQGRQGYQSMVDGIYAATHQSRPSQDMSGYSLLTTSRQHYVNRFAKLHNKIDEGMGYLDALQVRDELRSNTYLRRKSAADTNFQQQRNRLIQRLDRYVNSHVHQPRKTRRLTANLMVPAAAAFTAVTYSYHALTGILW